MLRPSTAPRWKIAIRIFWRACAACAARAMKTGVNPRLTSAALPFLRKTLRVIMIVSPRNEGRAPFQLPFLELRRSQRQRDDLLRCRRLRNHLARGIRGAAGEQRLNRAVDGFCTGVRRER